MADINPILQAAKSASSAASQGSQQIQQLTNSQADSAMSVMDIVRQKSGAEALISDVEQLGKLKTQEASLKVADIYGTNVDKQSELLTQYAAESKQAFEQKNQARKDIAAKQATNFFDNPIDWISARFTINDDIAKFNEASSREASFTDRQKELNALTQVGVQTQKAIEQTLNKVAIQAKSTSILATGEMLAEQSRREAIGYNLKGVEAVMKAPLDQLAIASNVFHAQGQQESHQVALANLALSQERASLDREAFTWKKESKLNEEQFDSQLIETFNKGGETIQGTKYEPVEVSSKQGKFIASMLKSNSEAGKAYQAQFFAGQSGVVAPTIGKVIDMAKSGAGIAFTPTQEKIRDLIDKVAMGTVARAAVVGVDVKDVQARWKLQGDMIKTEVDNQLKEIKVGSGDLFDPPSMNTVIKLDPKLQALPVVQKVLGSIIASGVELTPEKTLPLLAEAVQSGVLTSSQAQAAASIFQRQVAVNIADKQLIKFGIVPKEALTSFNTRLTVSPSSLLGRKQIVNITDPLALSTAISKYNVDTRMAGFNAAANTNMGGEDINTMFQPK